MKLNLESSLSASGRPLPRIHLRKRPSNKRDNLTTVDSTFLAGIFADIEESPRPAKKLKSLKSLCNLKSLSGEPRSPVGITTKFFDRKDSLVEHLNYVGTDDNSALCFPSLPISISKESSNQQHQDQQDLHKPLTRVVSDLQTSELANGTTKATKESYGWFVEIDDQSANGTTTDCCFKSANDLAFVAPTAPKADNHDAQIQFALAADTVDDVLGDFF